MKRTLSGLNNVLLFLTDKCNLSCDYCYVRQGNSVMDVSLAKKVIDNVDDGTIIDFFGGEPTLFPELIREIVDYASENDRHLIFQLFSNGTLIGDEILALARSRRVNIGISFDGYGMLSRTHSEELAKVVLNNAVMLNREFGNGVKCAITPDNVGSLLESVQLLASSGVHRISHFILREDVWSADDIARYREQLKRLVRWYDINFDSNILDYLDSFVFGERRAAGCWAGREGVAVNFNGDLYPCQRFLTDGSKFVIGNVDTGVTNKSFCKYCLDDMVGCSACPVRGKCNNCCIASQYEHGSILQPIKCVCDLTRVTLEEVTVLSRHRSKIQKRYESMTR